MPPVGTYNETLSLTVPKCNLKSTKTNKTLAVNYGMKTIKTRQSPVQFLSCSDLIDKTFTNCFTCSSLREDNIYLSQSFDLLFTD